MKLSVRDFISFFIFWVSVIFSLYCIISEMNKEVSYVFSVVNLWWSSDVTFFIPVKFCYSSNCRHQHVNSNVKFTLIVKKNVLHVFLNYKWMLLIGMFLNMLCNFIHIFFHKYSIPSIWIFSRLNNPNRIFYLFCHFQPWFKLFSLNWFNMKS